MLNDPKHQLDLNQERVGPNPADLSGLLVETDNMIGDMFSPSLSPTEVNIKAESEAEVKLKSLDDD